jgi:hypothetical protein
MANEGTEWPTEAAAKNGVTVQRIVAELAKIALARPRKAMDRHG